MSKHKLRPEILDILIFRKEYTKSKDAVLSKFVCEI
jgi:hypothetical protein